MKNEECCNCGVIFGMTDYYYNQRREDHKTFYCPNGHGQSYTAETEAEKYKRLYNRECANSVDVRTRLEAATRSEERAKKKLADLKKRTAAGVCPCCTRTVSQLSEHMKAKHPEYRELAGLAPLKQLPEKVQ